MATGRLMVSFHALPHPQLQELAMDAAVDPSRLSFESVLTRRRIVASYWLVIILAIPLWWKITSIDRLSLPEPRVRAVVERRVSPS